MFVYHQGELFAEQVPIAAIAKEWGTPCYIYSRASFLQCWKAFSEALAQHRICYAVKANSNLAVLNLFAQWGAGFDIVSVGELERVIAAGGDPAKVVFSGVGKREDEIARALEVGIDCFNVESETELERLNKMGKKARIALRVNPDISAETHPYISTGLKENKFGIDVNEARALYQKAAKLPNIQIAGIAFHIGSQITELTPFLEALDRCLILVEQLIADGIVLEHIDVGGGLGVCYQAEKLPSPAEYMNAVINKLKKYSLKIIFSPGRALTAQAGILVTTVNDLKHTAHQNFAVVDAAMNDLLRPALYDAWHEIVPVRPRKDVPTKYDVVGPVCETSDFLGKSRALSIQVGDLLAIQSAGAYGFSMSSTYNSRGRVPEIMVDGTKVHVIRPRESIQDLFHTERII